MGSFEKYKLLWEQERADERDERRSLRKHHVTAKKFFDEIATLKHLTNDDPVFEDIQKSLNKWGLVTADGEWKRTKSRKITTWDKESIQDTLALFLSRGHSLRGACAQLAWECDIRSATFESAVDYLKHIYRASQDQTREDIGEGVELDI